MNSKELSEVALTVRTLSMDAIQKANSGHPGLPLGCAELGSLLYGELMKYNPAEPQWLNRDRFVLSAGHGSMLLYSLLHLAGFNLSLEDIKQFRQLHSKTPGHPEHGRTEGVETTTGPLGQGFANAVGFALAERLFATRFNTSEHTLIDHYTYSLVSDGDIMEGMSSEAASLAGHWGLGKLIVLYDANNITIDGSTDLCFTEDVLGRYKALGWHTEKVDGYDAEAIRKAVENAKAEKDKPSFIQVDTIIGKSSPNLCGTSTVHGQALGDEELRETKRCLGVPEDKQFYVHPGALEFFSKRQKELKQEYENWNNLYKEWAKANPDKERELKSFLNPDEESLSAIPLPQYKKGSKLATRNASGDVINAYAEKIHNFIGGSADLGGSNKTIIKNSGGIKKGDFTGRNIYFGIREHGMAAICNGLALYGGIIPYCASFLVFSDYMRASIRMAALMELPVKYVLSHDSIYVGEDGPTHQPMEHVNMLRTIHNLTVLRPGDAEETGIAWRMALKNVQGPTALILTRQKVKTYEKENPKWAEDCERGAYIVKDCNGKPDIIIVATGSEVNLALDSKEKLDSDYNVRVVSMICRERFNDQDAEFKQRIVPSTSRVLVVEAGTTTGWDRIAKHHDDIFGLDSFGTSGPGEEVAEYFGMTAESFTDFVRAKMAEQVQESLSN